MLQYVIAGLVIGGIYAIAASGLVVTFLSSGILNLSFAALAFTVARFYYYLNSQLHWAIAPAALLSILVLGPAIGVFLYFALFRAMQHSSMLVKVLATLGLSVALPALDSVIFGNQEILAAPGLAPEPVKYFHWLGVPVTLDQIIVYGCVVAVVVVGVGVLRYTDVGLRIRAMVDSPAMTSLSGTSPNRVSLWVWAVSVGLAGLTGVLSAPIIGLDPGQFTYLMVAAFSAVIAAKMRSLPVAFFVGLAMGIAGALVQYALPPDSSFTAEVLPSIPFVTTALFLVYFMIRSGGVDESAGVGGTLDRAIRPKGGAQAAEGTKHQASGQTLSWRAPTVAFAAVCLLPLIVQGFWLGLVAEGVCFGIVFLSYTLVTGEGGMIWLCQATFAGVGGFTMAILAVDHGWPVGVAIVMGGVVALPFGLLLGFLMIRMGDLYVALVTLTFGLLFENLVFSRYLFQNNDLGIPISKPHLVAGGRVFTWFALAVFAVVALITVNLRNSTTGLALGAVRSSEMAAKTIGISVLRMKVLLGGLAAFVAGIGGAMLALSLGVALSGNYEVLLGVIWLTVLVTQGIRFNTIALLAGLAQTLVAGVALVYLPKIFGNFVPVFFGLGAIAIVRYPEGIFTFQARQFRAITAGLRERTPRFYDRFKWGAAGYAVAFLVLIVAVKNLWWLWLAITFFGFNVAFGYGQLRQQRYEKREAKNEAVPVIAPPSFVPTEAAQTDLVAPH
jgi:branched-chain amino acid transport system permease protein